jgi:hypothetical protein
MRASRCGILVALLFVAGLHPTAAAAQTISRLGASVVGIPTYTKGSNVAYDYKNGVYLVVSAFGNLNGVFVSADGAIGTPFVIQGPYTHFPGVAYSPDLNGGAGGFLVTWHQTVGNGAIVHGKIISSAGVMGPDIPIGSEGSWWEASVDVAYSTASKEFFVVWQSVGIRGQRVGLNGELLGTNMVINTPVHGRDPAVAYNPTNNEFFITWGDIDAASSYAAGQRIAAGSGAFVGAQIVLGRATGVYITDVAYNSATNQYLASWWQGGTYGVLVNASGGLASGVVPLSLTVSAYDALSVSFNSTSGTFLMTSHVNSSFQDGAVEIAGATATPGAPILATDIAATKGNFYPKVASRVGKAEWLLSTATDFAATTVQRLGSGASGGGTPPPPPPPPPPPCAATPTVTSMTIAPGVTTFPIDVNAPSGCAWTATSSAPWLQIFYHASATGPGSVGLTAYHNTGMATRTATVTIGSQTVTVRQLGFNAAAVTDIDGDGLSDLLWQYRPTGALAAWTMKGNWVVSTQWLNAPAVTDPAWRVAGTGDINGDGYADLVWQNANDGTISAWLLRGTQILTASVLNYSPVNPSWKIRAVADVNGDGKADIIWQHDAGWLAVWVMDGFNATTTWSLSVPRMLDPSWIIVGAGDLNNDGRADLVWQSQTNGQLAVWFLNGANVLEQRPLSTFIPDLNWKIRGVGDVSGDGTADLLWQNDATGALGVWYLSGSNVVGQWNLSVQKLADIAWLMIGPG